MSEETKALSLPDSVDLNDAITDFNNKPIVRAEAEENEHGEQVVTQKDMLLGDMIVMALLSHDESMTDNQRLAHFALANKCNRENETEDYPIMHLSSRQKQAILKRGASLMQRPLDGGGWGTVIYARIYEALEGEIPETFAESEL